jgi:putative ATPase
VSLPAISTGIYGFPKPLGAQVILAAVQEYLDEHADSCLRQVRLCNVDSATSELFVEAAKKL